MVTYWIESFPEIPKVLLLVVVVVVIVGYVIDCFCVIATEEYLVSLFYVDLLILELVCLLEGLN